MKRPRAVIALAVALIAIVVWAIALASGDGDDTKTSPASQGTTTGKASPPSAPGDLPPEFVKCMANQGYDVRTSDDMHSAPLPALQACLGVLHGGG